MNRFQLMAIAVIACTAGAEAAETYNAGGVAKGKNQTTIEIVSEGHMLMHTVSTYGSFQATDSGSPYDGMTGKCWGAVEIKVPGASGGGNCAFTNASGDKNFNSWSVKGLGKDGALLGTWTVLGGTGKYQNASGGGTFNSLADRNTGMFVNTIEGALTLK